MVNQLGQEYMPVERKATVLKERGIDVRDWDEGYEAPPFLPVVWFAGDEDEGIKVVELCRQVEIDTVSLSRQWDVSLVDEPDEPLWMIEFYEPAGRLPIVVHR